MSARARLAPPQKHCRDPLPRKARLLRAAEGQKVCCLLSWRVRLLRARSLAPSARASGAPLHALCRALQTICAFMQRVCGDARRRNKGSEER
jgi:hypothetical protein